ncbi:hypothetical protein ScPMuIL_015391 [Solemya velum]
MTSSLDTTTKIYPSQDTNQTSVTREISPSLASTEIPENVTVLPTAVTKILTVNFTEVIPTQTLSDTTMSTTNSLFDTTQTSPSKKINQTPDTLRSPLTTISTILPLSSGQTLPSPTTSDLVTSSMTSTEQSSSQDTNQTLVTHEISPDIALTAMSVTSTEVLASPTPTDNLTGPATTGTTLLPVTSTEVIPPQTLPDTVTSTTTQPPNSTTLASSSQGINQSSDTFEIPLSTIAITLPVSSSETAPFTGSLSHATPSLTPYLDNTTKLYITTSLSTITQATSSREINETSGTLETPLTTVATILPVSSNEVTLSLIPSDDTVSSSITLSLDNKTQTVPSENITQTSVTLEMPSIVVSIVESTIAMTSPASTDNATFSVTSAFNTMTQAMQSEETVQTSDTLEILLTTIATTPPDSSIGGTPTPSLSNKLTSSLTSSSDSATININQTSGTNDILPVTPSPDLTTQATPSQDINQTDTPIVPPTTMTSGTLEILPTTISTVLLGNTTELVLTPTLSTVALSSVTALFNTTTQRPSQNINQTASATLEISPTVAAISSVNSTEVVWSTSLSDNTTSFLASSPDLTTQSTPSQNINQTDTPVILPTTMTSNTLESPPSTISTGLLVNSIRATPSQDINQTDTPVIPPTTMTSNTLESPPSIISTGLLVNSTQAPPSQDINQTDTPVIPPTTMTSNTLESPPSTISTGLLVNSTQATPSQDINQTDTPIIPPTTMTSNTLESSPSTISTGLLVNSTQAIPSQDINQTDTPIIPPTTMTSNTLESSPSTISTGLLVNSTQATPSQDINQTDTPVIPPTTMKSNTLESSPSTISTGLLVNSTQATPSQEINQTDTPVIPPTTMTSNTLESSPSTISTGLLVNSTQAIPSQDINQTDTPIIPPTTMTSNTLESSPSTISTGLLVNSTQATPSQDINQTDTPVIPPTTMKSNTLESSPSTISTGLLVNSTQATPSQEINQTDTPVIPPTTMTSNTLESSPSTISTGLLVNSTQAIPSQDINQTDTPIIPPTTMTSNTLESSPSTISTGLLVNSTQAIPSQDINQTDTPIIPPTTMTSNTLESSPSTISTGLLVNSTQATPSQDINQTTNTFVIPPTTITTILSIKSTDVLPPATLPDVTSSIVVTISPTTVTTTSPPLDGLLKCGISVKPDVNISDATFRGKIETGLFDCYEEGLYKLENSRRKKRSDGTRENGSRSMSRSKREASGGGTGGAVITQIERNEENGKLVHLEFYIEEDGRVVLAEESAGVLQALTPAEMSAILHYPVVEPVREARLATAPPPTGNFFDTQTIALITIPSVIVILATLVYMAMLLPSNCRRSLNTQPEWTTKSLDDLDLMVDIEKGEIVSRSSSRFQSLASYGTITKKSRISSYLDDDVSVTNLKFVQEITQHVTDDEEEDEAPDPELEPEPPQDYTRTLSSGVSSGVGRPLDGSMRSDSIIFGMGENNLDKGVQVPVHVNGSIQDGGDKSHRSEKTASDDTLQNTLNTLKRQKTKNGSDRQKLRSYGSTTFSSTIVIEPKKVQIDLSPNRENYNSQNSALSVDCDHDASMRTYNVGHTESSDNGSYYRAAHDFETIVRQKSVESKQKPRKQFTDGCRLNKRQDDHRHNVSPCDGLSRKKTKDFGRPPRHTNKETADVYRSVFTGTDTEHFSALPEQSSYDVYSQHIAQEPGGTVRGTGVTSFPASSSNSNIDSVTNVHNFTNRYPPMSVVYSNPNIQTLPFSTLAAAHETRVRCAGVVNPCFLSHIPPSDETNQELLTAFSAELPDLHGVQTQSESREDTSFNRPKRPSKDSCFKHSKKREQKKKLFVLPVNSSGYQRLEHHRSRSKRRHHWKERSGSSKSGDNYSVYILDEVNEKENTMSAGSTNSESESLYSEAESEQAGIVENILRMVRIPPPARHQPKRRIHYKRVKVQRTFPFSSIKMSQSDTEGERRRQDNRRLFYKSPFKQRLSEDTVSLEDISSIERQKNKHRLRRREKVRSASSRDRRDDRVSERPDAYYNQENMPREREDFQQKIRGDMWAIRAYPPYSHPAVMTEPYNLCYLLEFSDAVSYGYGNV